MSSIVFLKVLLEKQVSFKTSITTFAEEELINEVNFWLLEDSTLECLAEISNLT